MPQPSNDAPPPKPPTRRGPGPLVWVALGTVGALVAGGAVWLLTRSKPQDQATVREAGSSAVTLEVFDSDGPDPFVGAAPVTAGAPALPAMPSVPTAADPDSGLQLVRADTPQLFGGSGRGEAALYGGSNERTVCDPQTLIDFLDAHPDRATAWADVFGLSTVEISSFVRSLTPVVLLRDTAVTNHGFATGRAVPRQSVLQAGSAVLVDGFGVPAVRCACGNPLLGPEIVDLPGSSFIGTRWSGFDPAGVLSVRPAGSPIGTFTLVDVVTGQPLELRAGTPAETLAAVGEAGVALSDDGVTWHPVEGSPTGHRIAAGDGTLVVPGPTTMSSADGGLTWLTVTGAPADATFAAFDGEQWLLLTEPDPYGTVIGDTPALQVIVHTSPDLATWTPHVVNVALEPLPPAEFTTTTYVDVVTFAAGDGRTAIGVLLADHEGTNRQYLLSSTDLATWERSAWDGGAVVHPHVAWNGDAWGVTAFRYDGALREGDSHGLAGTATADLTTVTINATTDDVGLGSLDHSATAGWIAAGWRGSAWQDPALYRSADLNTWTRVGDLPGHGFDVAAVTAGDEGPPDLSPLPTLAAPVSVTGAGCAALGELQPVVTVGQLTCPAIARILFDTTGPQTGGQKVAPRWHHWDCSWDALTQVEAGRSPAMACGQGGRQIVVEYWPADKVPAAATGPTSPAPGECVHTNRYGTFEYTMYAGTMDCADRIATLDAFFARLDQGDYGPAAGWNCFFPSGEDVAWSCSGNEVAIRAVEVATGSGAGTAVDPGGDAGGASISVSQPMSMPACDGTPIVIYASAVTPGRHAADVQAALDAHPGASWVRTDRSCSSFTQATADGGPIYAVFRSFGSVGAACAEVAEQGDSVGRRFLDNGSPSTSVYSCS